MIIKAIIYVSIAMSYNIILILRAIIELEDALKWKNKLKNTVLSSLFVKALSLVYVFGYDTCIFIKYRTLILI